MRKKAGWASKYSSRPNIVERRSTALGTPVRQPLMSIVASRMLGPSRSVTLTPGRADSIANKHFECCHRKRLRLPTLSG